MTNGGANEFVINRNKVQVLKELIERIRLLFSINVIFQSTSESSEKQWIQLSGGTEHQQDKAKEYVQSICGEQTSREITLTIDIYNKLSKYEEHMELERDSCAVIKFRSGDEHRIIIYGSELAVAVATSKVEEEIKCMPTKGKFIDTKVESEKQDPKASQKTSLSVEKDLNACKEVTPANLDPSLKEFAMKLDYTEEQIDSVVKKFGPQVSQDKLLHELIRSSAGRKTSRGLEQDAMQLQAGRYSPPAVVARGAPRIKSDVIKIESQTFLMPADDFYEFVPPEKGMEDDSDPLRHIVIDGSNVAMQHGGQRVFSCRGILLCVEYFQKRGHREITVFVPRWRMETPQPEYPISDQGILLSLEQENILTWTPSRRVTNGRRIVCYDDRFILELAYQKNGIVVSNDNYKDLLKDTPKWKDVIEQRLLMYSFVGDLFMVPDDPLGRHGPSLDDFLRKGTVTHPKICPFLKNCTFGLRCKYYHPERDPNRNSRQSNSRVVLAKSNENELKYREISPENLRCSPTGDHVQPPRTMLVTDCSAPTHQSQITRVPRHSDIVSRGPPSTVTPSSNRLSPDEYLEIYPEGPHHQYRQTLPGYRENLVPVNNGNMPGQYYGYNEAHFARRGVYVPGSYPDIPQYYPAAASQQWTGYYHVYPPQTYSELYASNSSTDKADAKSGDLVYSKLKELFPLPQHEQLIRDAMKENPKKCENNDINFLVNFVLSKTSQ